MRWWCAGWLSGSLVLSACGQSTSGHDDSHGTGGSSGSTAGSSTASSGGSSGTSSSSGAGGSSGTESGVRIFQFGEADEEEAYAIGVDGSDNVVVLVSRRGAASSAVTLARFDRSLTPTGGILVEGHPSALAVDAGGDAIVVGSTVGLTDADGGDAGVWRYTPDGYLRWKQQLGSDGLDGAVAVNVDAEGNTFVLWSSATLVDEGHLVLSMLNREGKLLGTSSLGKTGAVLATSLDRHGHLLLVDAAPEYALHKYDARGTAMWTAPLDGYAGGIYGGNDDASFVVGTTDSGSPALTRLGPRGTELFSVTFGGGSDFPGLVAADALGRAFVVGGSQKSSTVDYWDGFVRLFDTAGEALESWPLLSEGTDTPKALAVDSTGALLVAGTTEGALPGQTHFGDKDAFIARVVPRAR